MILRFSSGSDLPFSAERKRVGGVHMHQWNVVVAAE